MSKIIKAPNLLFSTFLIGSLVSSKTMSGQDSILTTARPVFVHASLLYDFPKSYGITAGVNYPFRSIEKKRVSKDGRQSIRQKDKFWLMEAAVYRYPYNYTGILLVPAIGTRHYVNRSFLYETSLGIGILRTFYDGKVYEVDASGNVQEKSLFGRFYATTHLSSAFIFLLQKPGGKTLAFEIKPSIWFQYPFESFIKPHVSLEAGIKYEIDKGSTKTRQKVKHLRK